MTMRQKVWTGLAVTIFIMLSPGIAIVEAVGSPFFVAFSIVPLAVLGALLVATRSRALFWSAAAPALALMLLFYASLRFSADAQTPIALLFVPLCATAAAFIGAGTYALIFHFRSRRAGRVA